MSDVFPIKRNDLGPPLTATLRDANGAAVNLTGATVKAIIKRSTTTLTRTCTLVDAINGKVSAAWQTGDTNELGVFPVEFEATFAGGPSPQTFPSKGFVYVAVSEDLG